ncbi:MAG: lipoyl synthase [Candidatus Aminicenantes bacterium]|nr:lipoyl synthase [Candidatus Aminicenantes bacterium]
MPEPAEIEGRRFARKPAWLKVPLPSHPNFFRVADTLKTQALHTICRSARCPNIAECWSEKTATFLLLGDVCTRSCRFCAVNKGVPGPLDEDEPNRVAEAAAGFGLIYVVLTSVTRDDLPDGGASAFARTIAALKDKIPGVRVETLIPDFQGDERSLETVLAAGPEIVNHNLEVPETLYPAIGRPRERYRRSLRLLETAGRRGAVIKSGLMLGLGETPEDLERTLSDLRGAGCKLLTLGQYLQPSREHIAVRRYCEPEEFAAWKQTALNLGFRAVESGPLVRSSYHARRMADLAAAGPGG